MNIPLSSTRRVHVHIPLRVPARGYVKALEHVIIAFQYLSSLKLHYCENCDEEWPVFAEPWPQTGVQWTGHKAGRCETIERTGFQASWKDPKLCSRCSRPNSAYSKMYSKENLQHLGERHPALSALTWYESLLIARVHPVVSVITMTATGLLCYAGHVCNYYVKVMEWMEGLPAVLRDKKWFLIKRRKSIRAGTTDTRQKKPTTANRYRLEAAIKEVLHFMPQVYEHSTVLQEELNKFPAVGKQEMLEQEETVDLSSEVHLSKEVFTVWFDSGATIGTQKSCAAIVHRYATDQQGVDMKGSVSADTAWELCSRLLSLQPQQNKISTREIAALLVFWLEELHVPQQMGATVYDGMLAELKTRNKHIETNEDEQDMKCRWIRQAIHLELDSVREEWATASESMPVDFEVGVARNHIYTHSYTQHAYTYLSQINILRFSIMQNSAQRTLKHRLAKMNSQIYHTNPSKSLSWMVEVVSCKNKTAIYDSSIIFIVGVLVDFMRGGR